MDTILKVPLLFDSENFQNCSQADMHLVFSTVFKTLKWTHTHSISKPFHSPNGKPRLSPSFSLFHRRSRNEWGKFRWIRRGEREKKKEKKKMDVRAKRRNGKGRGPLARMVPLLTVVGDRTSVTGEEETSSLLLPLLARESSFILGGDTRRIIIGGPRVNA